jgi:hypothetical protein
MSLVSLFTPLSCVYVMRETIVGLENMLHTDPPRGQRIPSFIADNPLEDLISADNISQDGTALIFMWSVFIHMVQVFNSA